MYSSVNSLGNYSSVNEHSFEDLGQNSQSYLIQGKNLYLDDSRFSQVEFSNAIDTSPAINGGEINIGLTRIFFGSSWSTSSLIKEKVILNTKFIYCFLMKTLDKNDGYYFLKMYHNENKSELLEDFKNKILELFDAIEYFVVDIMPICVLNQCLDTFIKQIPLRMNESSSIQIKKILDNLAFFNNSSGDSLKILNSYLDDNSKNNENYIIYNEETNVCRIITKKNFTIDTLLEPIKTLCVFPCDDLVKSSISSKVIELLDNKTFSSKDNVLSIYNSLLELQKTIQDKLGELKTSEPIDTESQKVKNWIKSNYEISDNVEYRIKAMNLAEILEGVLNIPSGEKMAFRNRLSHYLIDLGLSKKRFSDGFYYYGLRSMTSIKSSRKIPTIEELMKERKDLIEELNSLKVLD